VTNPYQPPQLLELELADPPAQCGFTLERYKSFINPAIAIALGWALFFVCIAIGGRLVPHTAWGWVVVLASFVVATVIAAWFGWVTSRSTRWGRWIEAQVAIIIVLLLLTLLTQPTMTTASRPRMQVPHHIKQE
jgi:hypothetical protein